MANGIATTTQTASVVKIGRKKCRPFNLQVMVYAPESGYKAEIIVERGCTASNDSIWKFVFDLFKKKATGDGFDQLVPLFSAAWRFLGTTATAIGQQTLAVGTILLLFAVAALPMTWSLKTAFLAATLAIFSPFAWLGLFSL